MTAASWNEEFDVVVIGFGGAGACAASRFIFPPEAFVSGILVNCDESLYGATLSRHISEQPDKKAWLVIDAKLYRKAGEQMKLEERLRNSSPARILSGEMNALIFHNAMAFVNRRVNRIKARSISALETRCCIPAGRSAAGVCSRSYVSGLSLADCIFTGRNAGRSAAGAVHASRPKSKRK
jgi:succinate dehydrogenase/fumarate reductase flavoprotein subunit